MCLMVVGSNEVHGFSPAMPFPKTAFPLPPQAVESTAGGPPTIAANELPESAEQASRSEPGRIHQRRNR